MQCHTPTSQQATAEIPPLPSAVPSCQLFQGTRLVLVLLMTSAILGGQLAMAFTCRQAQQVGS